MWGRSRHINGGAYSKQEISRTIGKLSTSAYAIAKAFNELGYTLSLLQEIVLGGTSHQAERHMSAILAYIQDVLYLAVDTCNAVFHPDGYGFARPEGRHIPMGDMV